MSCIHTHLISRLFVTFRDEKYHEISILCIRWIYFVIFRYNEFKRRVSFWIFNHMCHFMSKITRKSLSPSTKPCTLDPLGQIKATFWLAERFSLSEAALSRSPTGDSATLYLSAILSMFVQVKCLHVSLAISICYLCC